MLEAPDIARRRHRPSRRLDHGRRLRRLRLRARRPQGLLRRARHPAGSHHLDAARRLHEVHRGRRRRPQLDLRQHAADGGSGPCRQGVRRPRRGDHLRRDQRPREGGRRRRRPALHADLPRHAPHPRLSRDGGSPGRPGPPLGRRERRSAARPFRADAAMVGSRAGIRGGRGGRDGPRRQDLPARRRSRIWRPPATAPPSSTRPAASPPSRRKPKTSSTA